MTITTNCPTSPMTPADPTDPTDPTTTMTPTGQAAPMPPVNPAPHIVPSLPPVPPANSDNAPISGPPPAEPTPDSIIECSFGGADSAQDRANTAPKPNDVFSDLEAIGRTTNDLVVTEKILTSLELRKPRRDEWVRCHATIAAAANIYESSATRDTYLILPGALEAMENVVKHVRLTLTTNFTGELFIWPVPVPLGNKPFKAHVSAHAASEEAQKNWVRIAWNGSTYEVTRRKNSARPPDWGDTIHDASEMLRLCASTGGLEVIESPEHPVVQELLGLS